MPVILSKQEQEKLKQLGGELTTFTERKKFSEKELVSLEKADEIALYYGFTPVSRPTIGKPDPTLSKFLKEMSTCEIGNERCCSMSDCLEQKVATLLLYQNKEMVKLPQPVMLSYTCPTGNRKKPNEKHFGLEILGSSKSVAEATILKTALAILEEEGYADLSVEINSLGDKDSAAKFVRELSVYYRKNIAALPTACRQALKRDSFDMLTCPHEKCKELAAEAPRSVSFLSEKSRVHFKEVLEYLETMNVPYTINNSLVGKRSSGEVVFEIHDGKGATLVTGFRYDGLAKRIGMKKEIPAVGACLIFDVADRTKMKRSSAITKKPKFYFIQLGFDAKLKSLRVIEILRKAKVPLYQSLSKDKLVGQMQIAENLKIPFTIIMGQREAMEDSVIVRNMTNRSQETVKIADLPAYLEKVK